MGVWKKDYLLRPALAWDVGEIRGCGFRDAREIRYVTYFFVFFFSSRRRHTRFDCDWSSDVCSSDLGLPALFRPAMSEKMVFGLLEPAAILFRCWLPNIRRSRTSKRPSSRGAPPVFAA